MSLYRRAAKRDLTEPAIVAALEAAGAKVWRLSQPLDLLVGRGGRTVYEAWRTRAHPAGPSLLATGLATAEEARARCLDDALTAAAGQP